MVSAGELEIKGSIDTTMIERGFAKIKKGFQRVQSGAKSFGADMVRIGQATAKAAKSMGIIATIGLTAMIGLAKSAPAVAPAMEKIGIEFQRLSRVLGTQLRPFFDKFSEAFVKFVNFVDAHPNITKGFALSAGAIAGVFALTKLVAALSGAVSPGMLAALAIIGAGVGAGAVATNLGGKTREFLNEEAEQIPGTIPALRATDPQLLKEIRTGPYTPTPEGLFSENLTGSRKNILLRWWDSVWS